MPPACLLPYEWKWCKSIASICLLGISLTSPVEHRALSGSAQLLPHRSSLAVNYTPGASAYQEHNKNKSPWFIPSPSLTRGGWSSRSWWKRSGNKYPGGRHPSSYARKRGPDRLTSDRWSVNRCASFAHGVLNLRNPGSRCFAFFSNLPPSITGRIFIVFEETLLFYESGLCILQGEYFFYLPSSFRWNCTVDQCMERKWDKSFWS